MNINGDSIVNSDAFLVSPRVLFSSCIVGSDGREQGVIKDCVFDLFLGRIVYVMVAFHGKPEGRLFAVPWPMLTPLPDEGVFRLSMDPDDFSWDYSYDRDDAPHVTGRTLADAIYRHYRCTPYWITGEGI